MVGHRLAPGVEHGGDADLGAEPSGVGGDGLQCLTREPHQQCCRNADKIKPGRQVSIHSSHRVGLTRELARRRQMASSFGPSRERFR